MDAQRESNNPGESPSAPAPLPVPSNDSHPPFERAGGATVESLPVPAAGASPTTVSANLEQVESSEKDPLSWIMLGWGIGFLLMLIPLLRSALVLRRTEARAGRPRCGPLYNEFVRIGAELGVSGRVRLLLGREGVMPMGWGVFTARVLLPAEASEWAPERRRAVLLHELSHLRRRDPLSLLLAHLALAVHWVNPLVWLTVRAMRTEQERACDDAVLRQGLRPSDYATEMLSLSAGVRPAGVGAGALMMARPCGLEERIAQILDVARNRRALARRVCVAVALVAMAVALPLAMLQAAEKAAAAEAEKAESFDELVAQLKKESEVVNRRTASPTELENLIDRLAGRDAERTLRLVKVVPQRRREVVFAASFGVLGRDAKQDVAMLVKRVNAIKIVHDRNGAAVGLVRAVAERDPHLALDAVRKLKVMAHVRGKAVALIFDDFVGRDVEAAAAFLLEHQEEGGSLRPKIVEVIGEVLGVRDLEAALVWARKLRVISNRSIARHAAVMAMRRRGPGAWWGRCRDSPSQEESGTLGRQRLRAISRRCSRLRMVRSKRRRKVRRWLG